MNKAAEHISHYNEKVVKEIFFTKASRRNYLGGSDAAVILGVSPYKTPYELWREKKGLDEGEEDKMILRMGHYMENFILDEYCKKTGETIKTTQKSVLHPRIPFLRGTIDAITETGKIIEFKTNFISSIYTDVETGSPAIPKYYLAQIAFYSALLGTKESECVVLSLDYSPKLKILKYKKNVELEKEILRKCVLWWDRYITSDNIPDPIRKVDLDKRYTNTEEKIIQANSEMIAIHKAIIDKKLKEKELKESLEKLKVNLKHKMGDNTHLVNDDGEIIARWSSYKSKDKTCYRFNIK